MIISMWTLNLIFSFFSDLRLIFCSVKLKSFMIIIISSFILHFFLLFFL